MPSDFRSGPAPSQTYTISTAKQCPGIAKTIVISNKDFTSHALFGGNEAYLSAVSIKSTIAGKSLVAVHEFGHLFGDLRDEYHIVEQGKNGLSGSPNCLPYECGRGEQNCVDAKTSWGEELANKAKEEGWKGCGGACDSRCTSLLRPRLNSIMRHQWRNEGNSPEGRGDTFSDPALKQLKDRVACIGGSAPCLV